MSILTFLPTDKKPYKWPYPLDPQDKRLIKFIYRPPVWTAATVYIEDQDIVLPTVFNGFAYKVTSGGISDAVEPTWPVVTDDTVLDNDVEFTALAYKYMLDAGINISASSWNGGTGVTVDNTSFDNDSTQCRVYLTDTTLTQITLTNTITFGVEEIDRSIIIPIKSL